MSEQLYDASQPIQIKPIVNYPREAQVGQTYLMTIDLQLAVPDAPWPYPDEEYPISFILNMQPYFRYEALSAGHRPGVVLHRFGGTYGPAHYLLTASEQPVAAGRISITFVNGWGLPITHMELECEVRSEAQTDEQQAVTVERKERVATTASDPSSVIDHKDVLPSVRRSTLIEEQLLQAGWIVQNFSNTDVNLRQSIAVRHHSNFPGDSNFPGPYNLPGDSNFSDDYDFSDGYILLVDLQIVGIIKARPIREPLAGVEKIIETAPLAVAMESWLKYLIDRSTMRRILPFVYETTGIETRFTNWLEPEPRSRSVITFHRPETLAAWLRQAPVGTPNDLNDLLRSRLLRMPPLQSKGLYPHQFEAIDSLEHSLASNHAYTLLQMTVNTGMTHTAAYSIYRLLNYAGAKRILYVLDSLMAAEYTYRTLSAFTPPDSEAKFSDLYSIHYAPDGKVAPNADVCITTLERLYDAYFSASDSQANSAEGGFSEIRSNRSLPLEYLPELPIEYFDAIFIGNCASYTYRPWRALVAYFDAFVIGIGYDVDNNLRAMFANNVAYEQDQRMPRTLLCTELAVPAEVVRLLAMAAEGSFSTMHPQGLFLADEQMWMVRIVTAKTVEEFERAIQDFQPDFVCSVGTASGLRDVQPGDVVVATAVYRYDEDAFRVRPEILLLSPLISQLAISRANKGEWLAGQTRLPVRKPRVFVGPLVDTQTAFTPPHDAFMNVFTTIPEDAFALDTQISNFLQAVQTNRVSGETIVRGISERQSGLGDRTAAIDQHTALQHAYAFTFEILAHLKLEELSSPMEAALPTTIEIFCSFSPADGQLINRLKVNFLALSERYSTTWHEAVAANVSDYQQYLNRAQIILVFMSANYFDSKFIWETEIPRIMQRFEAGNVVVIPLILRAVLWRDSPLGIFGALPEDDLPIESSRRNRRDRDNTVAAIVREVETLIEKLTRPEPYAARQVVNSFLKFIQQNKQKVMELQDALAYKRAGNPSEIVDQLIIELQEAGLSLDSVWEAYWQLEPALQVLGRNEARTNSDLISLIAYAQRREHDKLTPLVPYRDKVYQRFDDWLRSQQRVASDEPLYTAKPRFTKVQLTWLSRVREYIAADLKFEEQDFDRSGSPFALDGGLIAARALFGDELPAILQELNSVLVQ